MREDNSVARRREFGRWLARCREAAAYTQQQAAQRAGVSRVTWARWETGTTEPARQSIPSIAAAVGCPEPEAFAMAQIVPPAAAERAGGPTAAAVAGTVRAIREARGLSQSQVAQWLGVTPTAYGHYERGRTPFTVDHMTTLSRQLGVPVRYLFGERANEEETVILALWECIPNDLKPIARRVLASMIG